MYAKNNIELYYCQDYYAGLELKIDYLRNRFIAKTILRRICATIMACGMTRSMSTLYTVYGPDADTQTRKNDQADQ